MVSGRKLGKNAKASVETVKRTMDMVQSIGESGDAQTTEQALESISGTRRGGKLATPLSKVRASTSKIGKTYKKLKGKYVPEEHLSQTQFFSTLEPELRTLDDAVAQLNMARNLNIDTKECTQAAQEAEEEIMTTYKLIKGIAKEVGVRSLTVTGRTLQFADIFDQLRSSPMGALITVGAITAAKLTLGAAIGGALATPPANIAIGTGIALALVGIAAYSNRKKIKQSVKNIKALIKKHKEHKKMFKEQGKEFPSEFSTKLKNELKSLAFVVQGVSKEYKKLLSPIIQKARETGLYKGSSKTVINVKTLFGKAISSIKRGAKFARENPKKAATTAVSVAVVASVASIVDPVNASLHATDVASVLSILNTGVIKEKSNKSITNSLVELAPEKIKRKIKQGRKNMRRKKARKGRSIF